NNLATDDNQSQKPNSINSPKAKNNDNTGKNNQNQTTENNTKNNDNTGKNNQNQTAENNTTANNTNSGNSPLKNRTPQFDSLDQFVDHTPLADNQPSLDIFTAVRLHNGEIGGIIYQKIAIASEFSNIFLTKEKYKTETRNRLFYFYNDKIYPIIDTLKPFTIADYPGKESVGYIIIKMAKSGKEGKLQGVGLEKIDKIGNLQKVKNYGLLVYSAITTGAAEKPLLPITILLGIIVLATIVVSGLATSLLVKKQELTLSKKLSETEAFLESLREEMSDGFILVDHDLRVVTVNSKPLAFMGTTRENLVGKLLPEIFDNFEDTFIYHNIQEVIRTGKAVLSTDYIKSRDIYFQGKFYPISRGIAIFFSDITEETKLKQKMDETHAQLQALTSHLQQATENEREAIAREIHDELGQVLSVMKINLSMMKNIIKSGVNDRVKDNLLNEVEVMSKNIDKTVKQLRRIITELRPEVLDHLGFVAAVEWLVDESKARSSVKFSINTNFEEIELDKMTSTALFRIIQESCTNIIRHSEATTATIDMNLDNGIFRIKIRDNGRGFDSTVKKGYTSFGLIGMRERAKLANAEFSVESEIGKGTVISLTMKLS
ncbi:MAG: hypothetical protein B6D45_07880, partial [Ignavibacteriales bacterium UTCHB3]